MSTLPVHAPTTLHPAMSLPASPAPRPREDARTSTFDLRFFGGILRRRWLLLSSTVLGISLAATGYVMSQEPVYASSVKIMIGLPQSPTLELANLVSGLPVTTERIQNEIQILQSRALARDVVLATGLDNHPDYNPAIRRPGEEPSWLDQLRDRLPTGEELVAQLGLEPYLGAWFGRSEGGQAAAHDPLTRVVDAYLSDLSVWPEGRSHVINVEFEAKDPVLAATIANAAAEIYIQDRLEAKLEAARRAGGWLEQRIEGLRTEAEAKEAALEAYRSSAGLAAGEGAGLAFERISELNRELAVAKAAEVEAEAHYTNAQETLRTRGAEAIPEVLSSRTIQELRAAEAVAAATRSELGLQLGVRHPRMIDINAQLRSIRGEIAAETRRILDSLRSAYEVARTRSERIESEMASLSAEVTDRNEAEAGLRVLEREAEAAQEVYRTFLMRANSSGQQESLEAAEGRLISAAEVPVAPDGPPRRLLAVLGFVFACFAGLAVTLGREMLDRRFRTADQIRERLNVPVLGVVPMLGCLVRTRIPPQHHIAEGPDGAFGEAIRALRTSLAMIGTAGPPRSVLMTSSVPGEGKTTLSLSIGRHSALSGMRTVVIDCDFRRPRIHDGLGIDNGPGVIDYLSGAPLTDVIRIDQRTGMHFISAGPWRRNAPELLRHSRMGELISMLQSRYDLVLIDSPPLLPVSDAAVIAGLAEAALLVVGWQNARPELARAAAERLRQSAGGARIAAVFNNVDVHQLAGYGSVEADVYRGRYGDYYAAA
ncbi:MAG TPA: Wzz/FepE/Etk N-terminal domain-containing protein [Geminicoccaceae bacterium]